MPRAPLISIILVTWNGKTHLPHCLSALLQQTLQDFEIILVDNGSVDDSVNEKLASHWPGLALKIMLLGENKGFAIANNIGARMAKGKWIVLLNVDAFPEPNWLENLLKAAEENSEYTSFSSRQVQANAPSLLDGEGDAFHVSGLAWRRHYNKKFKNGDDANKEVFSACGAAAMYLWDDFLNMGGFDEDYFSYFEDVDLGFRMRMVGKKCLYVSDAVVHHIGSASVGKKSDFSVYYGYRNLIWTYIKNMPFLLYWLFFPLHVVTLIFIAIYMAFRGQGLVILKAYRDAIYGIPGALRKRRLIQKNINVSSWELLRVMSTELFESYREFIERYK